MVHKMDSTGELSNVTEISDVTDLNRYLVTNIDQFAGCLAEKLLVTCKLRHSVIRNPNS